jgi:IS30 family transposase
MTQTIEAEILDGEDPFLPATKKTINRKQLAKEMLFNPRKGVLAETAKIVEFYAKGIPQAEIAKVLNLSQSTIDSRLKPFKSLFLFLENSASYAAVKSQLFDAAEYQVLSLMLRDDKLEKASLSALTEAFKALHNANRLTKGLSTENQAKSVKFTSAANLAEFSE